MTKCIISILSAFALGSIVPLSVTPAQADGPRAVKNAVLQLVTDNDGKDDTDVFTVTVANGDGKILERVYDAKEEIKPRAQSEWLATTQRSGPGATIVSCPLG